MNTHIVDLKFDDVRPDDNQPRKLFDTEHLAAIEDTWKERGQITPARVRRDATGLTPYVIIDGECRWRVGKKLHEAQPTNPIFATFRVFVDDVEAVADDVLIVQFVANSGKGHTPTEKADVMQRLLDAGVPRNKIRARLGVPPRQFRQLREFLDAPSWLRQYGSPTTINAPVTGDDGAVVLDENGRSQKAEVTVAPLPLTHLALLTRFANVLVEWDQTQQSAHPHGEHRNVAEGVICHLANRALRDGLSVARLTKMCTAACCTVTSTKPCDVKKHNAQAASRMPFVRSASGALRIPTTDPTQLSGEGLSALVAELESALLRLRACPAPPVASRAGEDVTPW